MTDPTDRRHDATVHVDAEPNPRHTRAPSGEEYHVKITASTAGLARDGGVIAPSAWDWPNGLGRFQRNPVILWAHQHHEVAVARAVDVQATDRGLVEWWRFHEETELSQTLRTLYENGDMRAASVGFIIHETADPTSPEGQAIAEAAGVDPSEVAWIATKAELLETSAVNVGSDPEALTDAARSALADVSLPGEDPEPVVRIDVRDGETPEEAVQRFVAELIRAKIGAPTTSTGRSKGRSASRKRGGINFRPNAGRPSRRRPVDVGWQYLGNRRGPGR